MASTDVFILNVGSGSCTVIKHTSGRLSMIDVNNGRELRRYERLALIEAGARSRIAEEQAELVNPIEWFQHAFGGEALWRFILTHPDADHMAGIRCILNGEIEAINFWDLPHDKVLDEFQTDEAREDWEIYKAFHDGEAGAWPKRISPTRFETGNYWAEDGIEILSPSTSLASECNNKEDWNNLGYVLRVSNGGHSVLLPADIEQGAWDDLTTACCLNDVPLKSDFLVASHHGRKSGYPGSGILKEIDPIGVIVSAAKIPAKDDAIPQYRREVGQVVSTRDVGSLLVRLHDDGRVEIDNGIEGYRDQGGWSLAA